MELYVHIPFCRKKCRYCSFTSFIGKEEDIESYIDLILKEAEIRRSEFVEQVETVYFGGGTPSVLPPLTLARLVEGLQKIIDFSHVNEFTSEANPGTVTDEWLRTAVFSGINRISFGMQAAQERLLQLLGRIHIQDDVRRSVCLARRAGINNISLDLMFGIPTQSIQDWQETLNAAIQLNPDHISAYGLIPESGTPLVQDLENGTLALPDPDLERDMYDLAIRLLFQAGLYQYEISSFSRKGYECRHNIGYWTQIPYVGLGISAASMTNLRYSSNGMTYLRRSNPDTAEQYRQMIIHQCRSEEKEIISSTDSRFETMMLGLRMNKGVNEHEFFRKHHISVAQCYEDKLKDLERNGLIVHENGSWKLTRRGFDIQNSILVELME